MPCKLVENQLLPIGPRDQEIWLGGPPSQPGERLAVQDRSTLRGRAAGFPGTVCLFTHRLPSGFLSLSRLIERRSFLGARAHGARDRVSRDFSLQKKGKVLHRLHGPAHKVLIGEEMAFAVLT